MIHTYRPSDYDIFIGIDTDNKSFSFTVKDRNIMKKSKRIPSNPEQMYNYIRNVYGDKRVICAYEAGPTGFGLYDYLQGRDLSCVITSPLNIPKPANCMVKTNRIDSDQIAEHLKSGALKPVRVPEGAWRELRHLTAIRTNHAQDRKRAKSRIHALLLLEDLYSQLSSEEFKWSNFQIKELRSIKCSPAVRIRLDDLLDDLEYARKKLLSAHRSLKAFCDKEPGIKRYLGYLQSIYGIGFVVSVTLLGKIGDPAYLRNPQELGAFCGLVPREHSTGDSINRGSITRLGSETLRFLLIEAAWVAIRKDVHLQQFYNRIKSRHHPRIAAKKAITAVARKLTLIIYRVLKDQRNYISYHQTQDLKEQPLRICKDSKEQ